MAKYHEYWQGLNFCKTNPAYSLLKNVFKLVCQYVVWCQGIMFFIVKHFVNIDSTAQKWTFLLKISLVNVNKSAENGSRICSYLLKKTLSGKLYLNAVFWAS